MRFFAKFNPYAWQSTCQSPPRDPHPMQMSPVTPQMSYPSNIRTFSSSNTTPTTFADTFYCTIDTSKMADNENERMSAGSSRTAVDTEIRTMESYMHWRCRAVTVGPKTQTGSEFLAGMKPSSSWSEKWWSLESVREPGCFVTNFIPSKSTV
ncbi:hypothetical protein PENSUB_13117 [Penicillium subrubescens]|uniref:Uncharacterized protein n=1 Tax=Penicillium subrubescens TaxID=1316194 RepID=A0A1Q5ST18_9EURO|nr:hypothetical protein PENSUB_13117 [Penicillium subrubescens]